MGELDFPSWYGVGAYGGLAASLLAAAGVASYALARHRGTPRQLARAVLVCLVAACLMLGAVWWSQNRLDLYGPALEIWEVLLWLSWTALAGWVVPLGTLAGYLVLAASPAVASREATAREAAGSVALAALLDPARANEPLGSARAWGQLVALTETAETHTVPLTRQLTLFGREMDNDIVVDDERTSRHHAEIRWDHGHVHLLDYNSMNGTLVNRQAVRGPMPLKSGDVIEMGAQRYRFELLITPDAVRSRSLLAEEETRKMPSTGSGDTPRNEAPLPLALVVVQGVVPNGRWDLSKPLISLGRDTERDICLPHESVSRLHAQIVRQPTGYFVSDLHSSNGTFLNGQPLTAPSLLLEGDLLRVGEIDLRCEAACREATHPASSGDAVPAPAKPRAPAATLTLSPHVDVSGGGTPASERERPRLGPPRLTPSVPPASQAD